MAKIIKMHVNGVENPIGFDTNSLSLSWIVDGTNAKTMKSAHVVIAKDEEFKEIIHDSGDSPTISSIDYDPKLTNENLQPRTRYYWKVTVTVDDGSVIQSPTAFFETSKLNEEWKAKWISTEKIGKITPPYVRKTIEIEKKVKKARVYVTGLGLYELYINGAKPTDEYLMPFNTNYKLWLQYQTFDVTAQLNEGKNAVGCILGDGWARGRIGFDMPSSDFTRKTNDRGTPVDFATDRYEFLLEMHVDYDDGSNEVFVTDRSWRCHKGFILCNNIYDGEIQDSNLMIKDWCSPTFDDSQWELCNEITEVLHEKLTPRYSLPIVVKRRLNPKAIIKTPAGETVIDMGQNMTGWLEVRIKAPKDFEVILEHGEILQDGNFFRENIRSALEQFRYISNGEEAVVRPFFTYYGFRYVRLTQWPGEASINDFVGCNVFSDLEEIGKLETGVQIVNQLISNGFWSQRDNFLDVPTDCPQRDERLGWTGDAQIFSTTAMFNMDCYAFYRKYLKDLWLTQIRDDGVPPLWTPIWIDYDKCPFPKFGTIGWSDAATIMPWNVYVMNGKLQILKDQYESMKTWADVMSKHIVNGLWDTSYLQLCDWLALDGPETEENKNRIFGGTELTFCCTVFYYISLSLTAKAAKTLGLQNDYEKYNGLAESTKKAIHNEYFTPNGRCAVQTQTALSLVIVHDLAPNQAAFECTKASLHRLLMNRNFHLCTGFVGTPILCRALTKAGIVHDAYSTFLVEDYPGWLYPVTMGATSMWERWDSLRPDGKVSPEGMNSFNHYAYASVFEWIYKDVCGLNPVEESPGFKELLFRPFPDARLGHAYASHESPMGHIECGWTIHDGKVKYSFEVPFNVTAKLVLLNLKSSEVASSNFNVQEENGNVVASLGTGKYEILYAYKDNIYELPNRFK